ncbi:MAG: cation:proton antiporter [Lachnospiraceae bacterium]|nr:cation:proton antiporter [Lachnospiraceae bacterium]
MQNFLLTLDDNTRVLLILSIILFAGFIMTRLTNTLNLPKVSGYILAGIVIGPYCMNLIPAAFISHLGFVSDLALGFIAFDVGKFFKKEVIMRTGKSVLIITLFEAMLSGFLVTVAAEYIFHVGWSFALVLGAIATATAPASTMMTINQYHAKGAFVDTLLQVVALDNVVCLFTFSIVSAIANTGAAGKVSSSDIVIPLLYNMIAIFLGLFCGYFLSRLLVPTRSKDNRLILALGLLLGLAGLCVTMDISPLLSCMVFGASYINLTEDKNLFRQINNFTPPVMSLFFITSGMNLDVSALTTVGAIGVVYFLLRIVGKYFGTFFAGTVLKTDTNIRNLLGLALIPQAGVAIGLAFLGQRLLPPEMGSMLMTIILSSSVLYEMIGPVCAKASLVKSGCIDPALLEDPNYSKEPEQAPIVAASDTASAGSAESSSNEASSKDTAETSSDTCAKVLEEESDSSPEDNYAPNATCTEEDTAYVSDLEDTSNASDHEDTTAADDTDPQDASGHKEASGHGKNKKKEGKCKKHKEEVPKERDLVEIMEELHSGVEDTDIPDIERVDVLDHKKEKKVKLKEKHKDKKKK